jgi:dephospho-CoA kinase
MPPTTTVFGVLGGIASGKSAVARALAGPQGRVLDADRSAHEVLASDEGRARVLARWGPGVLAPDGRPDRARIAERVFDRPAELAWLEGWIHPAVRVRMHAELEAARAAGVPRVALDVPLLLENDAAHGLVARCDALVFVDAPAALREERARRSRGWAAGELARREALQLPLATKRARAQHVIENNGSLADLEAAVARLLASRTPSA